MVAVCPSASGPTVREWAAMPAELVTAVAEPRETMPEVVCQVTDWLAAGLEFESARAWTVQVKVAPAARESWGVSEERVGGVPPVNWAWREEPLVSEAVTTDRAEAGGGDGDGGAAVACGGDGAGGKAAG